jgi:hypothetical protein
MLEYAIACDGGIPARLVAVGGIGKAKVFRLDGRKIADETASIQVINMLATSIAPRQAFWFTVINDRFYVVAPA